MRGSWLGEAMALFVFVAGTPLNDGYINTHRCRKAKERSDEYLILAALLALDAHVTPVTAKQTSELLKLHLGAKSPVNVNASLRAYKSYVSPQKGTPLRWMFSPRMESNAFGSSAASPSVLPRTPRHSNRTSA